jgi:CRP-like cAMP-binding protein
MGWPMVASGRVPLVDLEPDLMDGGSGAPLPDAERQLSVLTYRLARGPLPDPEDRPPGETHLGFLILSGLLMREVVVGGRPTAELLGPGDLLRPWVRESVQLLPRTVNWTVVEKATVAELGGGVARRLTGLSEVVEALIDRSVTRAQTLALERSIASHVRVDVRVLAFLWHLAERWGVVVPGAVRIDVPLTHSVLARMVGARRPTVTTALQRLVQLGYLRREGSAFILIGDPTVVEELGLRSPSRAFALPDLPEPAAA